MTVRAAGHDGQQFDYDLVIIGCGVGGHGAALHAVECVRCSLLDTESAHACKVLEVCWVRNCL